MSHDISLFISLFCMIIGLFFIVYMLHMSAKEQVKFENQIRKQEGQLLDIKQTIKPSENCVYFLITLNNGISMETKRYGLDVYSNPPIAKKVCITYTRKNLISIEPLKGAES